MLLKQKRDVCYLLQFTSWCQFLLLRTETVNRWASRLMTILHRLGVLLYWLMVWRIWKRDMCLHSCGLKVLRKWVWVMKKNIFLCSVTLAELVGRITVACKAGLYCKNSVLKRSTTWLNFVFILPTAWLRMRLRWYKNVSYTVYVHLWWEL